MDDSARDRMTYPSYHHPHQGQTPVIRPPQGFAWESSGSFESSTQPSQYGSYSSSGPDEPSPEFSRKKRSKDKSKSKDKHRSKHRSHEEYEPSTFDNRVLPNMAGPSTSRVGDNLPQARRPDHTTYPPSAEYPPPPHTPQNQDPPSYGGYMQRPSYPPYPQEGHPPREPPPGYTPLQHREHPSMDYAPQPPDHRRYSQERQPPHEQYERVTHENTRSPSAMSTREPQNQSSESADTSQNNVKPRIPRLITLLIEDMRLKESQLAEVRVPLKERPGDLIWADAVDITEALQAGPSRIDGPAKVSTMRGEFKQIFFRVSANGDVNCSSANVQVSPEKTVKVLVEDPDRALALHQYRTSAGMLTPNNDPMMAPPGMLPAPQPVPPGRFNSNQYDPSLDERRPSSSRKRPRSVSQEAAHSRTSQQWPQSRPPYRDVPPEPLKYQSSGGPPPPQRAVRHGTSRSPTPVSGSGSGSSSSSASPSGSDASPNAQPSQISPLSQAGSLTQMSPASIPNQEMAPMYPDSQDRRSHERLTPVPSTRGSPSSYPQGNSAASQYSPEREQQKPPSKKQKHTAHTQSPAPRNISNDHTRGPSSQPPMGFLAPPSGGASASASAIPPPQHGGAFASYSYNQSYGSSTPASTSQANDPSLSQRSPPNITSMSGGRPTPTAVSGPPAAFPQADPKVDDAVAHYLRSIFKSEPDFNAYVDARNKNLPVSKWIKHLQYVQTKFEQYVGKPVPDGVSGVGSAITKTQICRAFYQNNAVWGDECSEVVALSKLYGPEGQRVADPEAVDLYNEPEGVTTTLQMRRYLSLLKNIHAKWIAEHPE